MKIGIPDWTGDWSGGDFEILTGESGEAWEGSDKFGEGWTEPFEDMGDSTGWISAYEWVINFSEDNFIYLICR